MANTAADRARWRTRARRVARRTTPHGHPAGSPTSTGTRSPDPTCGSTNGITARRRLPTLRPVGRPATATTARRSPSWSRPPTGPPGRLVSDHTAHRGQHRPGHRHGRDHALAHPDDEPDPDRHRDRVHRRGRGPAHLRLPVVQERHPLAGDTSSTLDLSTAGNGNRGDLIAVSVTPPTAPPPSSAATDSVARGQDHRRSRARLRSRPASPRTNDTVTATPAGSPTPTGTRSPAPTVDEQRHPGRRRDLSTLDLSVAGNGDRGDTITVAVTATDGTAASSRDRLGRRQALTAGHGHRRDHALGVAEDEPDTVTATPGRLHRRRRGHAHLPLPVVQERQRRSPATPPTLDLSVAGNGDKGDTIAVAVTASDGTASSWPRPTPVARRQHRPGRGHRRDHALERVARRRTRPSRPRRPASPTPTGTRSPTPTAG